MEQTAIRRLTMLVGVMVIVALALVAVMPAFAQDGGQQGGVAVGADDSLGDILGQYDFTEEQLVDFLRQNGDLIIEAGETVTFPAGVTVNMGDDAGATDGDAAQVTPTTDAGGVDDTQATPTVDPGAAQATPTVDAGAEAGENQADTGFVCEVGDAQAGETYVTQENDTLGQVLGMMGFQVDNGGTGAGSDAEATSDQAVEFVYQNCDLDFEDAQTVVIPAGVPQTGGESEAQATPTIDAGGAQATPTVEATPTTDAGGAQATPTAEATPTTETGGGTGGQAGQQQNYTVQAGENLIDIANRFGVTLEELVRANPNLLNSGDVLIIPAASQGAGGGGQDQGQGIPQTGGAGSVVADFGPGGNASLNLHLNRGANISSGTGIYVVQSGDSLSSIARRFNTTVGELMAMNTGIPDQNLIFRGQRLLVPGGEFPGLWNNNLLDIDPRGPNAGQNTDDENTGEGGG